MPDLIVKILSPKDSFLSQPIPTKTRCANCINVKSCDKLVEEKNPFKKIYYKNINVDCDHFKAPLIIDINDPAEIERLDQFMTRPE